MKKLFEIKVRGYYILSVVAGILLGLSIMIVANVLFMQAELNAISGRREQTIAGLSLQYDYLDSADYENALQLMPLKGLFNLIVNSHMTVIFALLCIATVTLYVMMITLAKHWRTKFVQSIGWALLFLFVTETVIVNVKLFNLVEAFGVVVFLPAILLVVPVLILCKTRDIYLRNDSHYLIDITTELLKADREEIRKFVHKSLKGKPFYNSRGEEMSEDELVDMVCRTKTTLRQIAKR